MLTAHYKGYELKVEAFIKQEEVGLQVTRAVLGTELAFYSGMQAPLIEEPEAMETLKEIVDEHLEIWRETVEAIESNNIQVIPH